MRDGRIFLIQDYRKLLDQYNGSVNISEEGIVDICELGVQAYDFLGNPPKVALL